MQMYPVLNKEQRYEGVWWSTIIAPRILALNARWRFILGERATGIYGIGGWVGPRVDLDAVVKRKIPTSCWESKPQYSSP
jgi:hypothetical protein